MYKLKYSIIQLKADNEGRINWYCCVLLAPVVTSCVDNEDTTFNCKTYQDNYAMCQATSGTLKTIASNRCQKYCGLCGCKFNDDK